jgi:putative Mn2+ efflux pump MntP
MESVTFQDSNKYKNIKSLILVPCQSGLFGFAVFFSIILFSKFISYIIGIMPALYVEMPDIYLSIIGFVLLFLISLLKYISSIREKESDQNKSKIKVQNNLGSRLN